MDKKKFVIIANPRTGTNHFIDLLNSHEEITCHREVFHRDTVYALGGARDDLVTLRNRDEVKFMEDLYASSPSKVCGFKIFDNHSALVLGKVLNDPGIKKIVLYRANFLAVYSSERIAEIEQQYLIMTQPYKGVDSNIYGSSITTDKVQFEHDQFHYRWNKYQEFYKTVINILNNTGQNYLFITYEEFINECLFRRVFSFLGLKQPDILRSRMKKQNTSKILDRFSNPDQVEEYMKKIGRMNWIYEGFMLWSGKNEDE